MKQRIKALEKYCEIGPDYVRAVVRLLNYIDTSPLHGEGEHLRALAEAERHAKRHEEIYGEN